MNASNRTIAAVLLLGLALLLGGVYFLLVESGALEGGGETDPAHDARDRVLDQLTASEPPPVSGEGPAIESAVRDDSSAGFPAEQDITRLKPKGIRLSGRVVDRDSGEAVPFFEFLLQRWGAQGDWVDMAHERIRDDRGRFAVSLEKGGDYWLQVKSSRHLPYSFEDLVIPRSAGLEGLVIPLDPGRSIRGRVVVKETGEAVSGALVLPVPARVTFDADELRTRLEKIRQGFNAFTVHAVTDEDGEFTLEGLGRERQNFMAFHPDYAPGIVDARIKEDRPIEIRVERGYRISGRVLDDEGHPVPGIAVNVKQWRRILTEEWDSRNREYTQTAGARYLPLLPVVTGRDGTYRTPPVLPGHLYLEVEAPDAFPGPYPLISTETRRVQVVDRDVEVDFILLPQHAAWKGRLLDMKGEPLATGKLTARLKSPREDLHGIRTLREAWSAGDGRFRIGRLFKGLYDVEVLLPGMITRISPGEIYIPRPGLLEQDIRLTGGEIHGRVMDEHTGEGRGGKGYILQARSRSIPRRSYFNAHVDEEGFFRLIGLPAGLYDLELKGSSAATASLPEVSVHDGKVTQGIEMFLPARSRVEVRFTGFEPKDWEAPHTMRLQSLTGNRRAALRRTIRIEGQDVRYFALVEPGEWRLQVRFRDLGLFEKVFEVEPNKETVLSVEK